MEVHDGKQKKHYKQELNKSFEKNIKLRTVVYYVVSNLERDKATKTQAL